MKRANMRTMGSPSRGYTIVEVMIFLAVSGALLVSAMALINGKQERTLFTQSVVTMEQSLQDILNDVSDGVYPTQEDFKCSFSAGNVDISPTATKQGTNAGCSFIGKAIELGPAANLTTYNVYTVVGSSQSDSVLSAEPELLGTGGNEGVVDARHTTGDLEIVKVVKGGGGTIPGIALLSEFSKTSGPDQVITGNASRVSLRQFTYSFVSSGTIPEANLASISSATICLREAGSTSDSKKAALFIGISGKLTIDKQVGGWPGVICD